MQEINNSLTNIGFDSGSVGSSTAISLTITDNHGATVSASTAPIQIVGSGLSVTALDSGETLLAATSYQQSSATYFSTNLAQIPVPDEVVTAVVTDALGQIGIGLLVPSMQDYGSYPVTSGQFSFGTLVAQGADSITLQGSALEITESLNSMVYDPTVVGVDTIGVSLTDNHGGSASASSTIYVGSYLLGVSGGMSFAADPNQPNSLTASLYYAPSGDVVTVDMFAEAGALSLPGMTMLPNGGIEISGTQDTVNAALSQAVYTPDGSSANDNILLVASDGHGGYGSAHIPVTVNLPAA